MDFYLRPFKRRRSLVMGCDESINGFPQFAFLGGADGARRRIAAHDAMGFDLSAYGELVARLLALVKWAGAAWWLWGFALIFGFQLLMLILYPKLILPLFNKLTAAGVPIDDIYIDPLVYPLSTNPKSAGDRRCIWRARPGPARSMPPRRS